MKLLTNIGGSPKSTWLAIALGIAFLWGETLAPKQYREPIHRTESLIAMGGLAIARDPE